MFVSFTFGVKIVLQLVRNTQRLRKRFCKTMLDLKGKKGIDLKINEGSECTITQ